MNSKFSIGLIQLPLNWEAPEKNRKAIEVYLKRLKQPLDLVLLPEMFTSGFTMHPQTVAESMEGPTILLDAKLGKANQCRARGKFGNQRRDFIL
jgi:omega-amidase